MSWLVAVGVFLVALAVGYTVLSSEIGHQAAARSFFSRVLVLLAVVFLGFTVFSAFPASAKGETCSTLLLLLSAVCWGSLLYRLQRKRQAGNLLLDLGRLPRQRLFILGGGLIAWAGLLDIARPRAADYPVKGPVFGLFALGFAAYFLIAGGQGKRNRRFLRSRNLGADRLLSVGRGERPDAHRLGQSAAFALVPRHGLAHSPSP